MYFLLKRKQIVLYVKLIALLTLKIIKNEHVCSLDKVVLLTL